MNNSDFNQIITEQMDKCRDILVKKGAEYANDEDKLHNFKLAAHLQRISMAQALGGMMSKHTISVYDMIEDGEDHPIEVWDEKITDHINYLLLLKAVVAQEKSAQIVSTIIDTRA